jgi:hypothetical protein
MQIEWPEKKDNELYRASAGNVRSAMLCRVLEYWKERRQEREFPARADFDPLEMKPFLGNLVLFDVMYEPLRFRFRLVGTEFTHRFGIDPTNCMVDDYPRLESRKFINDMLSSTVEWRAPSTILRRVMVGDRVCDYEAVYMPLAKDGTTIDMLLACFEME